MRSLLDRSLFLHLLDVYDRFCRGVSCGFLPRVMTSSSSAHRLAPRPRVAAIIGVVVCVACAAPQREPVVGAAPSTSGTLRPEPGPPVAVSRTIVTPLGASSVEEIFARARVDYAERR